MRRKRLHTLSLQLTGLEIKHLRWVVEQKRPLSKKALAQLTAFYRDREALRSQIVELVELEAERRYPTSANPIAASAEP